MERLLLMDEKNYDEGLPEILRVAVRGIILLNGKFLFIGDKYGELKLPGGGQDPGETDTDTLTREVKEETGFTVIPESVRPFGYIEEKRLSTREKMVWRQISYLYFCDIGSEQTECDLSESEMNFGMHYVTCTLDEAIEANRRMLEAKDQQSWNQREYKTLLLLKEYFRKQ